MEIARLIREDFLKQNAFSDYDYYCPLNKTIGMMKCMVVFYDTAIKAIAESGTESKLTWSVIETKLK
jgi:V-type H+-transporting ATPase subunit A